MAESCKAEVGDFALCQWWDDEGNTWWSPCEVEAIDENGIATKFVRGRRRFRKYFWRVCIGSKSISDPRVLLPKLKSRYKFLYEAQRAIIAAMAECGLSVPVADE